MRSFNNGLSLGIVRDDSIMFNLKLNTKFLKRLRSLSRSIVSFQSFWQAQIWKTSKEMLYHIFNCLSGTSSCNNNMRKGIYGYMNKGQFSKWRDWVTSICQSTLGLRLWGLTPIGRLSAPGSHVWMWELDYKESWAPKNRCFWTVVLEETFESPLGLQGAPASPT